MTILRRTVFASLALSALVACGGGESPGASSPDASLDGAASVDGGQGADGALSALDAEPSSPSAILDVNGASYAVGGAFLIGYGATGSFNESIDNVNVNVQVQWSGAGVGTHPCTFALVYVFASTGLACDYEFSTSNPVTGGTCSVTITADGPHEGDLVVGTFTASLGPNPSAHSMASCPNPGTLTGSFTQSRPTSATDAG